MVVTASNFYRALKRVSQVFLKLLHFIANKKIVHFQEKDEQASLLSGCTKSVICNETNIVTVELLSSLMLTLH